MSMKQIMAPKMMNCRWLTVLVRIGMPSSAGTAIKQDWQNKDEGRTRERIRGSKPRPPMMTMNKSSSETVDVEGERFPCCRAAGRPRERTGNANDEGGDGKGRQLCNERTNAHELGRDFHIAYGHPLPPDIAANKILGDERKDRDENQRHHVFLDRRRDEIAEELEFRRGQRAGRRIICDTFDAQEQPVEKELRGSTWPRRDKVP